jgi:formiminotetrahydrofolate cyclodeaminase
MLAVDRPTPDGGLADVTPDSAANQPSGIREARVAAFLDALADRRPAPGGGAVAALQVALGAGLVAMVGRYSVGERYKDHAERVDAVCTQADRLRSEALDVADADATAFSGVGIARKLPRETPEQEAVRAAAVVDALLDAAWPSARTIAIVDELLGLGEELAEIGNRNLFADVVAAAANARAAAVTAQVNLALNLAGLERTPRCEELAAMISSADRCVARADQLVARVRAEVSA